MTMNKTMKKLAISLLLGAPSAGIGIASAFSPIGPPSPHGMAATATSMSAVDEASPSPPSSSSSSSSSDVNVERGERQRLYGDGLDLPDTYVRCGRCGASYALRPDDLGNRGNGRRVECSVCSHSWYQSRDRLFDLTDGYELVPFPRAHLDRIARNIEAGRSPDFTGVSKFYVGNLDYGCTEEDLYDAFKGAGDVGDVSLITDDAGRSRGFAFVTMVTKEDGERAMELDGKEVMGRKISVRPPNN